MKASLRYGAALAATALLIAPALWNGFPLLQFDTGGYLARWYEGYLVPSRAVAYGLLLAAGAPFDFWPIIALQAAFAVWIIALTLRAHGFGGRPLLLLAVVAVLSVATTLPWIAAILLTDIFAGLSVLALYLLVLRGGDVTSAERAGLITFVAYAVATHSATFAVLVALFVTAALARPFARRLVPLAGLGRAALALSLGVMLVFVVNFALTRRLAWTPGGYAISFGRMLQDGIVARYLDDHCPDPRLRLCSHRRELPRDADEFFWGSRVFDQLGRFAGLGEEMRIIALESLAEYPWLQLKTAAIATGRQLIRVATGEGVVDRVWHTYAIIEKFTPSARPAMRAARQQQGGIDFGAINRLHIPVSLASMLLLPFVIALAAWRPRFADLGALATTIMLAILANAFICGALSNPHNRYGARMVWIASLAVLLVPLRAWRKGRRPAQGMIPTVFRKSMPSGATRGIMFGE